MEKNVLGVFRKVKKEHVIVCILVGVLLVVIALPVKGPKKTSNNKEVMHSAPLQPKKSSDSLEEQLEGALQQVQGVGEVSVVITYETNGEKVVEKDHSLDTSGTTNQGSGIGNENATNKSTKEETIFEKDHSGNEIPYVISEKQPLIRGVLVVAKGADQPIVVQNIQEAVRALFQVEPHKIKVMKMK